MSALPLNAGRRLKVMEQKAAASRLGSGLSRWAPWYGRRGILVFPVFGIANKLCACGDAECKQPGKHPRTRHGFKDATTDVQQIRDWWRQWPDSNIGVPTGKASGRLVLDIDPRNGGNTSWQRIAQRYGSFPATAEQITGGGGRHFFFRDPGVPVPKDLAPGIDVKSDGGYVILAPSNHLSGREYRWVGKDGPKALLHPAAVSDWMLELFAERREQKKTAVKNEAGEKFRQGQRSDSLASLAGSMRRRGMGLASIEAALIEENQSRCEPPLSDKEVHQIAASISRYPAADPTIVKNPQFYVYTESGFAEQIADGFRGVARYCALHGCWYLFDGTRWVKDQD